MQMNDAHRPRTAFLCLARDLGGDQLLSVRRSFHKLKIPNIFDGERGGVPRPSRKTMAAEISSESYNVLFKHSDV